MNDNNSSNNENNNENDSIDVNDNDEIENNSTVRLSFCRICDMYIFANSVHKPDD